MSIVMHSSKTIAYDSKIRYYIYVAAFVQDDKDVQYLLDNIPISMHKVSIYHCDKEDYITKK